ncbi:MAG: DNA repair protein RadA [Candidatus Dormibacteraeota bacterium]|nr:DNA repair protein RadA [Candidatus Dormibacteraeota bacterium]
MARTSTVFVCRDCGGESLRWAGRCPNCGAWNTLEEFHPPRGGRARASGASAAVVAARPVPLAEVDVDALPRLELAWGELNRVFGGGLVPGSVVLLGGEPGVGKSTLLLHLAAQAADRGGTVLYTSGEESAAQVGLRARRLGLAGPRVLLLAETDLDALVGAIQSERPVVAIVDSVQTVQDATVDGAAGSVSQVREAAARLLRVAKETGVPVILVGHVTKEGAIAGPRILEHMVDTVLYLEGERGQDFRILRAQKNRFGSTDELGVFTMGDGGLEEVSDPSAVLLGEPGRPPVAGTAVVAAMEGSRALLVEVQSLVSPSSFGLPRRSATGIDLNRVHMIVAVLEKRAHLPMSSMDLLVNVAGGIRVQEPAADLALALAIASSVRDRPLPPGTLVLGELGLAGEVRRVGRLEKRLQEAARRGFARALAPRGAAAVREPGLLVIEVGDVTEAIAAVRLDRSASAG